MKEVLTEVRTEKIGNITLHNMDNMDFMRTVPDKYFDLAIVDPPYGIGASKFGSYGSVKTRFTKYHKKNWDDKTPDFSYFDELFRVSKNQIIWGGNYFQLPNKHRWIIWDKIIPDGCDYGEYELAWNSSELKGKIFRLSSSWNNGGNSSDRQAKTAKARIHPTQKPVALYKWLLKNYAKEGDKILDTHLGSGSIAIACHDYKFELVGTEIDSDYFNAAVKRIKQHVAQTTLF
ncbi:MAG: Modification methylase DpnIIB [Firmicutes bacterium ADurb.Bin193]|nr:MAG: Modification methylase DpnIIB [Firmicutes bacterium ADurb.Bin193]